MKMTNAELVACKKDMENESLSFMKRGQESGEVFRIFVNGNDDISFWVSGSDLENEEVMTVSREMFYRVFDVQTCNKVFTALSYRYSVGRAK
jgi:hypothetical protein